MKVQRINSSGTVLAEYTLTPDNAIAKVPGTFYSPDQTNVIYSFPTPITKVSLNTYGDSVTSNSILSEADHYKLMVQNSETGKTLTASTSLVNNSNFLKPNAVGAVFGLVSASVPNLRFYVQWTSAKNARLYELVIRFNYIDSTASGNIPRHLDWKQPSQKTGNLGWGRSDGCKLYRNGFYQVHWSNHIR